MKKIGALLLVAILTTALSGAYVGAEVVLNTSKISTPYWAKGYWGGTARAVAVAPNGDIIVVGHTLSFRLGGAGNEDIWVLRIAPNGTLKWQKTYGGKGREEANSVMVAPNGDIVIGGYTESFGAGSGDAWVLRLDENGNIKWQKTYGSTVNEGITAIASLGEDIIAVGIIGSYSYDTCDIWILRLDENGNIKWQKTYGGDREDRATSLAITEEGDIFVVGYTASFGAGNRDVWVLRLDENGNIKWQKTYGGNGFETAQTSVLTPNGDLVIAGNTRNPMDTLFVIKIGRDGKIKWQKIYPDIRILPQGFNAISITPLGNVILAVVSNKHNISGILQLDKEGNVVWMKGIYSSKLGALQFIATSVTSAGDIILAGHVQYLQLDNGRTVSNGLAIMKLPPEGTILDCNAVLPQNQEVQGMIIDFVSSDSNCAVKDGNAVIGIYNAPQVQVHDTNTMIAVACPYYGILEVSSIPDKAEVYIDESKAGKTPLASYQLPPGTYTVEIKKEGYEEIKMLLTLTSGEKKTLTVRLKASGNSTATSSVSGTSTSSTPTHTTSSSPATSDSGNQEGQAKNPTTTSSPNINEETTKTPSSPNDAQETKEGRICGPVFLVILALWPIIFKRRY